MHTLPKISDLLEPLLRVLSESGPMKAPSIESSIVGVLNIPNDLRSTLRSGKRTELNYRLCWARTKAKNLGYVERQASGHWQITPLGKEFLGR